MDDNQLKLKEMEKNPYTMKYRIFKTLLMIFAWVSFGINLELIGTALEDLRILLNVDYQQMSFALSSRSTSYMIVTLIIGLVMDKLIKYSELLMAVAKLLIIIRNYIFNSDGTGQICFLILATFLVPWIPIYSVSMGLFLLQGVGHAIYDVCGNQIIFRLWSGISESPVNAMHAGYGIGAMITVQLLKPFLKFNPKEDEDRMVYNYTNNMTSTVFVGENEIASLNNTDQITSSDIKLQIPYSVAGLVGVFTMCVFIVAQFFEIKHLKKSKVEKRAEEIPFKEKNEKNKKITIPERIFGRKIENRKNFVIISIELGIVFLLFMAVSAYNLVLTSYMLTYATKGPAKFIRDQFLTIQTFFWIMFIIGRFSAALFGFKLNSFYFFTALININTILVFIFNTKLNMIQNFYWFIILALGLSNGPLIPCCFAVAKHVFVKTNSFLISFLCIGLGVGGLLANYTTGVLLDKFQPSDSWLGYKDANSSYIIPLILLGLSLFCAVCTIIALAIYMIYKDVFNESDDAVEEN
jgi:FHS family Na+ dependent glucose MFS transporter 1